VTIERSGRDQCLRLLVEQLGSTAPGRDLGLDRVNSLADLRASVKIRDAREHAEEVEARWGFGPADGTEAPPDLAGAERERDQVVAVWRACLENASPERIAVLRGLDLDPVIEEIMLADVRAWGGELLRVSNLDDPSEVLARLEEFRPAVLVVPSLLVCRHLEGVRRVPLEARLEHVRLILAEHDLGRPIRSRIPVASVGWIERTGRVAVTSATPPASALTLATGSQILELLPYSNPEEDGRRVYDSQTILPEEAIVGMRYEVVCTSALGFLRVRTQEHVRVIGFDPPTRLSPFPRPRVVRLTPAPADVKLEGCTIAGSWLAASVRQALQREDPALVEAEIGPDPASTPMRGASIRTPSLRLDEAFSDTELGGLSRTGMFRGRFARPRSLLVRVELQGFVGPDLPRTLARRIDANLRRRSPAYAHLREREELLPPRVVVLPVGARRQAEERRVARLDGAVWAPEVRVVAPAGD
jgi:hypothetical protein